MSPKKPRPTGRVSPSNGPAALAARIAPRGRGSAGSPPNRFRTVHYEAPLWDDADLDAVSPRTEVSFDTTRGILSENDSPDVPFETSVNPYRGCEHGCAYCYARPTHEYLGYSAGLDFETKIVVKPNAPALLRDELSSPRWKPRTIAFSGVTDPYQPVERRFRLTRGCLEVCAEFGNPVFVVTKGDLVLRDLDLLCALARDRAAAVAISIGTLDTGLARKMEPRACQPKRRLAALEALAAAGIPSRVLVAPVVPGLNDHEMPAILAAAARAGASGASMVMLRLPHGVGSLFEAWLEREVPERAARVLARVRQVRRGTLNDPRFGSRMRGEGPYAESLAALFELARKRCGLAGGAPELSTAAFRRGGGRGQPLLFAPRA